MRMKTPFYQRPLTVTHRLSESKCKDGISVRVEYAVYEPDSHAQPFQTRLSILHYLWYIHQTCFKWQQSINHSQNWKPSCYLQLCEYVLEEKAAELSSDFG